MFENHHLVWYLQRMLVLQLHHAWNQAAKETTKRGKTMKHPPKIHTNRKQPNNKMCVDVKPPTPSPHLLPVLLLLPMSQLELQQLLELPSKKAPAPHGVGQWGGPRTRGLGWLLEEMDVFCVCVCVFFLEEEIKSMKVYSNLRDRNGNSAMII